jgi:hypothetical protein
MHQNIKQIHEPELYPKQVLWIYLIAGVRKLIVKKPYFTGIVQVGWEVLFGIKVEPYSYITF